MVLSWILFSKPDISMTMNGALAGLVGITASTAVVTPFGALIIGAASGMLVVLSVEFFDKILHIDDPVGAISVHGVCGAWGTIAVGLFANTDDIKGLFYGGGFTQLLVQIIGAAAVFVWASTASLILFLTIKKITGLRVTEDEELSGLDISEHGSESYNGFQIFTTM
jgi:ammonium transporter, Amt family